MRSALVHKYGDGSTGWVLSWGDTDNQQVVDPSTQVVIPVDDTASPDPAKPLWKQRIDAAGQFEPYNAEDRDAVREWLASRFRSGKTVLFQRTDSLVITDVNPVMVGCWVQDARSGIAVEANDARVIGAIFRWECPVAGRAPEFVARGFNPGSVEKHTLEMKGKAQRKDNDPTTSFEFWKIVSYRNVPRTFREWRLEVSVPTLQGSEQCTLSCLRVSTGRRGV